MSDENKVNIIGKLINNEKIREGTKNNTEWKLYQLIILTKDNKNKKISSFNKDYAEFLDKYVNVECEKSIDEKDGKTYTNYKLLSVKEMTKEDQQLDSTESGVPTGDSAPQKTLNKSPERWKKEQSSGETDWDAKERRSNMDNALVRSTGILQVAKDLGIITKENTPDLKSLKEKWFIIANNVFTKIYSEGKKEETSKERIIPINEVSPGTNQDGSSVEEEKVE